MEFHENHAAQTVLEEKKQELQKAVLGMANRAVGERVKKNNKKRKAEKSKDEQESAGKKQKKKERYPRTMMTVMRRMMGLITH